MATNINKQGIFYTGKFVETPGTEPVKIWEKNNTNLIKNSFSAPTNLKDYTEKASGTHISSDGQTYTNIYKITFPEDTSTYSNYNVYTTFTRDTDIAVQQDEKTYTLSFKVKASKNLDAYTFYYEYINNSIEVNVTTEWQTVVITGIATGVHSALYVCRNQPNRNKINGGTLYIADLKLEEGAISTPWCPHLADYNQLTSSEVNFIASAGHFYEI